MSISGKGKIVLTLEVDLDKATASPLTTLNEVVTQLSCIQPTRIASVSFSTKSVLHPAKLFAALVLKQGVDRLLANQRSEHLWLQMLTSLNLRSWCMSCRHPVAGSAAMMHKMHVGDLVIDRSMLVGLGNPSLLDFGDACTLLDREQLVAFLVEIHANRV